MGNETRYYFGAYLEIKVSKSVEVRPAGLICPNRHGLQDTYCRECGAKSQQQPTSMEYPTHIYNLLDDKYGDDLSVITPPRMFKTGIIIAIGNLINKSSGEWLYLDRFSQDVEIREFPTESDIRRMIYELNTNYENVIMALQNSPNVVRVTAKAGYVLDTEY